jgi:periplasmic protein TonB
MNSELIMKTDVLDILFEKRNKAYGAYMLRKFYKNRLIKSLLVTVAAVIVFSAFTLLPGKAESSPDFLVKEQRFGQIPPAPKVPEVKPRLRKPANITPLSTLKLLSNIVITDKKDSTQILHDLDNRLIGSNTSILLNNTVNQLVVPAGAGNDGGNGQVSVVEPPVDITKPIDNPEIMPEYPGGMEALRKFLGRNLGNPRDLDEGESISVKVKFVIGYDGKLQRFELVQDGGSEFNNEVIRVLKKMPAWIPGKSKGQNVSVFYTIPVKFIRED